jgi:tripartite-type tricarboxylate transporter receptor subunit TctC
MFRLICWLQAEHGIKILRGFWVGVAIALLALPATAQGYPDKPVRVIVSVPAGGTPDVVARMVAPGLGNLLGQQLVIDNRSGAGGLIGAELAARAVPDGYTLLFSGPSFSILPLLQKQAAYDAIMDFAPVNLVSVGPYLLITHPSVLVRTVKELIELARAEPGKLNYASAGNGSPNHLATELFKNMAGVNITHVPYKGAPQAWTDLLGGHMNLTFSSIPPVLQHIKAGRLRLLGISSARRSPQLPDVPTISETGLPGYEWSTWFGLLAPAKTPKQIVARLNTALFEVVRAPDIKSQFEVLGYSAAGSSSADFATFIRAESHKYAKVIKLSGVTVD